MVFKESYPHASDSISDWKGQMIYQFQEDLMEKVQDQVSEKWFYTHMKKGSSRLPRLDILNMLSRYAGFDSWDDFKYRTDLPVDPADRNRSGRVFIIVPLVVAGLLLVLWAGFKLFSSRNYTLCFASRDDPSMAVSDTRVEILTPDFRGRMEKALPIILFTR